MLTKVFSNCTTMKTNNNYCYTYWNNLSTTTLTLHVTIDNCTPCQEISVQSYHKEAFNDKKVLFLYLDRNNHGSIAYHLGFQVLMEKVVIKEVVEYLHHYSRWSCCYFHQLEVVGVRPFRLYQQSLHIWKTGGL